jgi:16S rRNA (cytidine1402-2'-O)-methyltransferase
MAGVLYAIPTPLGGTVAEALPAPALQTTKTLRHFVVENAKTARAFLKEVGMPCPIQELEVSVIETDVSHHIKSLQAGQSIGLLSEAGCPAIADPGALLIEVAQREGIRVVPLIGPSSIVLALMASGLEGQRFAFCGYLPRETDERARRIKELESRSRREKETQIFIETPYRNDVLLAALLESASEKTLLCVATDLTLPTEEIRTQSVSAWRSARQVIGKRPTVFLLLSQ